LYNMYGPTEAAVYVSGIESSGEEERITIGRPLQNCRIYVLDEKLRRVMPTARGELYLAGVCLASGYVGRPDLTAAAFVDDPFFPGKRMYKSGDAGRLMSDGAIEFLGRRDAQVKINGQRVEPDEVTARIVALPGVAEAATVVVEAENGEKRLRAAVVRANGSDLSENRLRAALGEVLPPFMVPAQIVFLEAMPRNASGKIDLKALKTAQPSASDEPRAGNKSAPVAVPVPESKPEPIATPEPVPARENGQKPLEASTRETLVAIWKQALGKSEIDPHETFFEQGGSSLSALDALSRCYNEGISLSLEQFYANPTLEAQTALLCGASAASGVSPQRAPSDPVHPREATAYERALPGPVPGESAPAREPSTRGGAAAPQPAVRESSNPVFLTGATGFLGAHLLDELAHVQGRDVICLVRGGDPARLAQAMDGYFGSGWYDGNRARVRVIAGDIGEIDFGLTGTELNALTGRVETILHCAADVRHYAENPDASLKSNAGGTANAVRLAARLGAGLAYVSTMSVAGHGRTQPFTELDPPADPENVANIYVRGKCAAELLVRRCVNLLPSASILRVGRLVGRESDGVFQRNKETNAFYHFVRGALALGVYPDGMAEFPVELTPVDACARAVALLLDAGESVYHVFNPAKPTYGALIGALADGKAERVPDDEFEARLSRAMAQKPSAGLVMLREMWDGLRSGGMSAEPGAERTLARLAEKGFVWREPDIPTVLRAFTQD
ncbi:MAG TPA: SDR family oxidoreductase, partial [Clostridia bacterium]|nr:SDR family oxidoreductase [Clostridia bacterium]